MKKIWIITPAVCVTIFISIVTINEINAKNNIKESNSQWINLAGDRVNFSNVL